MRPPRIDLSPADTEAILDRALRQLHGADARLDAWTAMPLAKRGKGRAVRYDVRARLPGATQPHHHAWVGKFYERDDTARRAAATLHALAASHCDTRGGAVVPEVVTYDANRRVLLLTYEPGDSVIPAIARDPDGAVAAIARAVAAIHGTPIQLEPGTSPASVFADTRRTIAELRARYPAMSAALRRVRDGLERRMPGPPPATALLHGDLGPAQMLWRDGRIVLLDFDKTARGDAAQDLGNLLTQLQRLTLRKPRKLPDFAALRRVVLDAYGRCVAPDPTLSERVAWYEWTTLLRKIHFLAFEATRRSSEPAPERQAEAVHLLEMCARHG